MTLQRTISRILGTLLLAGCATVPTTAVYREGEGKISRSLYILPIADNTPERHIDGAALTSLRLNLIGALNTSGRFATVTDTLPNPTSRAEFTTVKCRVSQFDTAARRMVLITELVNSESGRSFVRFVTHTDLFSMVWPLDYVAVMERAGNAAVADVVKRIVMAMSTQ